MVLPLRTNICTICKRGFPKNLKKQTSLHHISYTPEIVIELCVSCHRVIHRLGKRHTEETKNKIRLSKLGKSRKPHTEDAKDKIRWRMLARHIPESTRQRMSKSHLGKKHTDDTKQKISTALKIIHQNRKNAKMR